MRVTSKIKTIFSEELLQRMAALCDTKRIPSNNQKMIILGNLLYTYGVEFEILGGATNRIALQIDGYAVKIAMDHQGYQDNLVEYSLSPELQPYVTKSYETNGYIQIQECVEVMSMTAFRVHFQNMRKVLDAMCHDYLLGDVGTIEKNRTNWGIKDGKPIILDYAYCHRLSEELFTCEKCGMPLTYDNNYDRVMCSDTSACRATYSYNERKMIQGNQIDDDMIKERKTESIKLEKGVIFKDIELVNNRIVGDNYFIIDTPADMYQYNKMKEEAEMQLLINGGDENMYTLDERLSAIIRLAKNPDDVEAKEILRSPEENFPEPIYTDNYQERFMYADDEMDSYPGFCEREDEDEEDDIEPLSIGDMIRRARDMGDTVFNHDEDDEPDDIQPPTTETITPEQTEPEKVEEPEKKEETDEIDEPEPSLDDYEIGVNREEEEHEIKEPDPEPEKEDEPIQQRNTSQSNVSNATIIINGKEIKEGEEIEV